MAPKKQPSPPDYSLLTLAQLQKQVTKYGFKLSSERSVLISQLDRCWAALHPEPDTADELPLADGGGGEKVPRARGARKVPKTAEDKEEEERRAKQRLVELVRENEELYMKVLRYEPISFEQIVVLAQAEGLKLSRPVILKCMDEQSVTVYTMDPTDKTPRSRYR